MSLHQELILLYSEGKVAEIEQSHKFKQLCSKYQAVEGFEAERLRIRSFRKNLESLCRDQTNDAQVKLCLKLLSGEKNKENQIDYHDMIMKAYRVHWSDPQKEHFDNAYTILDGDVYFFLSFTTRSNTPDYVSKVNRENRFFLEDVFWPDNISDVGDLARENMLAAAIWRYLKDQGLSGFYYREHEGMSNDVQKKLRDNCNKSLTFLQLVQGVMFDYKIPNYCHFEYEESLKSQVCCKRMYVMGEEREDIKARRIGVFKDWLPWFDEIVNDVDALELISTRYRDDVAVKKNHEALKNKIVRQIEHIRDDLFENIPV